MADPHQTEVPLREQLRDVQPSLRSLSPELIERSSNEPLSTMQPSWSKAAEQILPGLTIDQGTAHALLKIDQSQVDAKIPAGGGVYQALRSHFSESEISNQDLARASSVIRDTRMGNQPFKAGEPIPTGQKYVSQDFDADLSALVKKGLGLPYTATEAQVDAVSKVRLDADVRKGLGLPADATDAQVDAAHNARIDAIIAGAKHE